MGGLERTRRAASNTQIAFKLLFPSLEIAVRPEQRISKQWKKEILYVDLSNRLPDGWLTVATVFVTKGNIRLQHERDPSIWLGSLDIGNGKWAQLVIHGDPELDVYSTLNTTISTIIAKAQSAGAKLPNEGFAYMLGRSSKGHRFIVGGRVSETAQAERLLRAKEQFPALKGRYHHFMAESKLTNLTVTYEQSPDFSVRYSDGATVKAMPGGGIYIGFFLERAHEYEKLTLEITPEGKLSKEIAQTKAGLCRQLQCAIVAYPSAARAFANSILQVLDQINTLELLKSASATTPTPP